MRFNLHLVLQCDLHRQFIHLFAILGRLTGAAKRNQISALNSIKLGY